MATRPENANLCILYEEIWIFNGSVLLNDVTRVICCLSFQGTLLLLLVFVLESSL